MVEEIFGKAVRLNFDDVECGPDPMHPSDNECISDEDEDSSDDDDIEEFYADLVQSAKARVQDVEIVEVTVDHSLCQVECECRITGVQLATSVIRRQQH